MGSAAPASGSNQAQKGFGSEDISKMGYGDANKFGASANIGYDPWQKSGASAATTAPTTKASKKSKKPVESSSDDDDVAADSDDEDAWDDSDEEDKKKKAKKLKKKQAEEKKKGLAKPPSKTKNVEKEAPKVEATPTPV